MTSTGIGFIALSAKRASTLVRGVHGGNFWKKIEHSRIRGSVLQAHTIGMPTILMQYNLMYCKACKC